MIYDHIRASDHPPVQPIPRHRMRVFHYQPRLKPSPRLDFEVYILPRAFTKGPIIAGVYMLSIFEISNGASGDRPSVPHPVNILLSLAVVR